MSMLGGGQGLLPSRIPTASGFERGSLAVANLVRMSPEAAARSLLAPSSLSPEEARTLADEMGATSERSIKDLALHALTNPLILAGVVLSFRYPIARAAEMFSFSKDVAGLAYRPGALIRNVGSMDDIFRGLDIPENYKKLVYSVDSFKDEFVGLFGRAVRDAEGAGLKWNDRTKVLLGAKLDGLDQLEGWKAPIQEGSAFDKLVADTRSIFDKLHDKMFGDEAIRTQLKSKALRKFFTAEEKKLAEAALVRGDVYEEVFGAPAGVQKRGASNRLKKATEMLRRKVYGTLRANSVMNPEEFGNIEYLKNYFPHMVTRTPEEFARDMKVMWEKAGGKRRVLAEKAMASAETMSTPAARARQWKMIPDPEHLKLIPEYVGEDLMKTFSEVGSGVKRYSLRADEVFGTHVHAQAKAYGWSVETGKVGAKVLPLGEALARETAQLEAAGDIGRSAMMKETYIPLALGRKTFDQFVRAAKWSDDKLKFSRLLDSKAVSKVLPADVKAWFKTGLEKESGIFSLQNLNARAAGWLYTSALGANPVSSAYNLMQYLLTTVPTIGPKYAMQGLQSFLQKAPKYFEARGAGMAHGEAVAKAFPAYVEAKLGSQPLVDEAMLTQLKQAWEVSMGAPGPVREGIDKVKSAMMAMFQASENTVRLATFEGARIKAATEGLKGIETLDFARRVTETTQFLSGPAMSPARFADWSPLARQFIQFPARAAAFLVGPGTTLGSGAQAGAFGRNWGTLGRTMATSGIAYEAGKELLGRDLSHGLMFGALPIPQEGTPFFPFPFVPPAASIAGAVASDVITSKWEATPFVLPLAVPGGLAMSRLATRFSPSIAKLTNREYADYEGRLEDGRVPIYTSEGSLKGYFSDMEVWSEALGVGGGSRAGQSERELMGYLIEQRDRMRGYRRDYLDAVASNDSRRADSINREFMAAYPFIPGGIQVEKKDLQAVHMRNSVTRIERALDTLPEESRAQFAALLPTAMAGISEQLLGVDPMLLVQQPTARSRDPWREVPPGNVIEDLYQRQIRSGRIRPQGSARSRGSGTARAMAGNPSTSPNPFRPRGDSAFGAVFGGGF